jgi:hypothetical protein
MNKNSLLSLFALALLAGGLVGCGENDVPENPSYARDIQPLLDAHCVRCHGGGGSLNGDPDVPPGSIKLPCAPIPDGGAYTCAPTNGNFTALNGANGKAGLATYAAGIKTYLALPMPPPPSEPLDDFETNLLVKWAVHQFP